MIIYFIDLDGTIEDSKKDMTLCVNMVRKELLLESLQNNFIEQHVNRGMNELYQNCFSDFIKINEKNFEIVKNKYEECYFNNVCIHTKCYEGIEEALEALSKKGKIVVVTNKPEKISRELLRKLNLIQFITDVMGGDSCAESKPSAMPLEIASKRLNFQKHSDIAYMIGDSLGDIKTAKAFGARSVWCSWGYLSDYSIIKADYIINYPSELATL
jgi:HAD superfamily hydrolase (TIGR01549 family)